MKMFIFAFTFMTTLIVSAGPEVPWPEVIEREVFVKDLQGLWVSKNLNNPQRVFEIKIQATDYDLSCPYLVKISEISPFSGKPIARDIDILCSSFSRKLFFILNDEQGGQKVVEMIGILKPRDSSELGEQYLGITVYNHDQNREISYQDIFYKLSE